MTFNATFLVSIISFILFVFIMNAIFYKPIEKIVAERKRFIDDNFNAAQEATEKSDFILKDKDEKLAKGRDDAKKILVNSTAQANKEKETLTKQAKEKSIETVETAKTELKNEQNSAQNSLDSEVINLAQIISDKILGENLPINSQEVFNG